MMLFPFFFVCLALPWTGAAVAQDAGADTAPLRFVATGVAEEYRFDTGQLRGVFREGGRSIGLLPVEHGSTGTPMARQPGILGYYRIFTTNHRYGESARVLPSTAKALPGGGIEVHWEAADDRPYELTGVYRWTAADTLDLDTVVTAHGELPDFEVFLASYLSEHFPATSVYVKEPPSAPGAPGFMTAEEANGHWQVYPRDAAALAIVQDGRWTIPPSPVDWAVMPVMAGPLAFRRDPETGLVMVFMAPPEDCFAVFTPCRGDAHYSVYLALFGRTLKNGETVRARSRLLVRDDITDEQIVALYDAYVSGTAK